MRADPTVVTTGHCRLLGAACGVTYLVVVMGGVVCASGSGQGCPDWPRCYGQLLPPPDLAAVIEMTHRFLALLAAPLIVGAAGLSWRHRGIRWVRRPPAVALALTLAVVVFGAFAVLTGLPRPVAAVDVAAALLVLGLLITAWVVALARRDHPALPDRLSCDTPLARWAAAAAAAVFLVLVSGVLAARPGSIARCLGWPLLGDVGAPLELAGWPFAARRAVALAAAILIVGAAAKGWRLRRSQGRIAQAAAALAALLVIEIAIGLGLVLHGVTVPLLSAHVAAAAGVWAGAVALAVRAALPPGKDDSLLRPPASRP
jgi:heme A synthase